MHKKYNPAELQKQYDAIIIGSGLGGLTTAALLSKSGKKVLVLERHFVPGGFTHAFKRKHFKWDVGVHYVGQVQSHKASLRKAFDYVTQGKLKWADMGEVYDKAIIAGKEYEFVAGKENQINKLISYFPDEAIAINKYFESIELVSKGTGMFFGEKAMPPFLSKWIGRFLRKRFNFYSDQTTYQFLSSLTSNQELIAVLCTQCGDYGLPPKKSSFAIHAMIADHYLNGGNYPIGGAEEIYKSVLAVIQNQGGEVLVRAAVKEILIENNTAVGVEMEDGQKIFSKKIISNAGARNTYTKLISGNDIKIEPIKQDLENVKPAVAHLCLYVGLSKSDQELNLPKWNYWVYKSYDFDGDYDKHMLNVNEIPPLYYISFPSAKDPDWCLQNPNTATIQVVVACSYEWLSKWDETLWMKRGEQYAKFKDDFTELLLQKLYEVVPQVKGNVAHSELSTPLTTKHFSNYEKGEIYGLEHTPARFRLNWLRPQSPIKNLYLTGQDTLTVGVGGALFSGVITASTLLKKNFMSKIDKHEVVELNTN
jgi:all-trans-retinol 13,14-reductase